jgi:glutamate dehydrogenase
MTEAPLPHDPRLDAEALRTYFTGELKKALHPRELRSRGDAGVREMVLRALPLLARRLPAQQHVSVENTRVAGHECTLIQVLVADSPFLVDTFRLKLRRLELGETLWCHARLAIERDEAGEVRSVGEAHGQRETYLYAEVPIVEDAARRQAIAASMSQVFLQVRDVVGDHARMVKALRRHTADLEYAAVLIEGGNDRTRRLMEFLSWLADDNFVFMGYRRYVVGRGEQGFEVEYAAQSGLGLMRSASASRFAARLRGEQVPPLVRARLEDERLVFFDKSRIESQIHREGRLDSVSIKLIDEDGRVSGFGRIVGLLTHKAIRTRGSQTPLLRERREQVLAALKLEPGSHDYKSAIEAYDSFPLEFLFPYSVEDVTRAVGAVLDAIEREEVAIWVAPDPLQRSFFVSVVMPRELYREDLRADIRALLLRKYGVNYTDDRSTFIDDQAALIHFFCTSTEAVEPVLLEALGHDVKTCITSWRERFETAMFEAHSRDEAGRLLRIYGEAFPEEYRLVTPAPDALADVEHLDRLEREALSVELAFSSSLEGAERETRLKLYQRERPYLTDLLPVLDHFALRVIDATRTELDCGDGRSRWIVSFRLELADLDAARERRILEGLRAVLTRRAEDDALNRLTSSAGLSWREVDLLRAYLAYSEQIGRPLKTENVARVLESYLPASRALVAIFRARFDPDHAGDRLEREREALSALEQSREAIATAYDDQVFGLFLELIQSTTRTNFYAPEDAAGHLIVLKLDPSRIRTLTGLRPFAEIFVHSAEMAGVHLRGGPVARGGIRFSDRPLDFRSEILGLMKTQMVKNGVIVPVGAKGGFVLKRRLPTQEVRAEADRQYARFIRGLLRITDDMDGEQVVAPLRVVRHDRDDPYLVVAADKGTAHLSDTANRIACELGFWLGDAFASGGSHGYDHKALAITAKGAWVSVKRHFLELGIDIEATEFTSAGIGDMSGDVFGNGLLLARKARLLAAFDHRHIFLDPNPDPETAWAERRRLFELPGSSWRDYDPGKISDGGGVYDRDARRIVLSPEARMALGVDDNELSGAGLIQAILRMPVDLLWNGGIGTYVKSSRESHEDVRDRGNDDVRVDARELRARVVGEGGNLGFTPRARAECALRGCRIQTDALDNSGGVDLSDHEVNFKILLASAEVSGRLTREARNRELRECAGAAVESVLANNASQSRCLSADLLRTARDPDRMALAAEFLARHAGFDPALERLPSRDELRARASEPDAPSGYLRPELAVLLGYTKMLVKRELSRSDVPDHASFRPVLETYFPEILRERYAAELGTHPLGREIIATCLTNRVIDQAGVTLVPELVRGLGVSVSDVISAYHVAHRLLEAEHLRWEIENEDIPERLRLEASLRVEDSVRDAARVLLGLERRPRLEPEELSTVTGLIRGLRDVVGRGVTDDEMSRVMLRVSRWAEQGLRRGLALAIETLPGAVRSLGVLQLASQSGASLPRVVRVHSAVGEVTRIAWLLDRLGEPDRQQDDWERMAGESLRLEMLAAQRELTVRMLEADDESDPTQALRRDHKPQLAQIEITVEQIDADRRRGLAPLVALAQQIRRLAA